MTVSMSRAVLIDEVKANRETHRALYDEAVIGYRSQVVKRLKELITDLENDKLVDVEVNLPVPQDLSHEYDLVIGMLETANDENVEVSAIDYRQLVMDRWHWKQGWVNTISLYLEIEEV